MTKKRTDPARIVLWILSKYPPTVNNLNDIEELAKFISRQLQEVIDFNLLHGQSSISGTSVRQIFDYFREHLIDEVKSELESRGFPFPPEYENQIRDIFNAERDALMDKYDLFFM